MHRPGYRGCNINHGCIWVTLPIQAPVVFMFRGFHFLGCLHILGCLRFFGCLHFWGGHHFRVLFPFSSKFLMSLKFLKFICSVHIAFDLLDRQFQIFNNFPVWNGQVYILTEIRFTQFNLESGLLMSLSIMIQTFVLQSLFLFPQFPGICGGRHRLKPKQAVPPSCLFLIITPQFPASKPSHRLQSTFS